MENNTPIHNLCKELDSIHRMERGKLSIIRQGPNGAYYNLQQTKDGKNVTEYIPASQLEQTKENIEGYERFIAIVKTYADTICEKSRKERMQKNQKKTKRRRISSSLKKQRSKG